MNKKSENMKTFKLIIFIFSISVLIYAIYYLLPIIKNISLPAGQVAFRNKIIDFGITGLFMLFALEVAQIFLVILPGEPLEILAGMCYGTIGGTIFLIISVFLTTSIIFYLVRRFGKKMVYKFCNKEKINKIEKNKIFNNPKKIEFIMFILFLIPGTPKDLLVYVGGILPIKPMKFILISTFARFPSIISSVLAGNNIIKGNWKSMGLIYLLTLLFVIVTIIIINIFDKNKEAKTALEIIK